MKRTATLLILSALALSVILYPSVSVEAGVSVPQTFQTGSGQKIQCYGGDGPFDIPNLYAGNTVRTCVLVAPTKLPSGSGQQITAMSGTLQVGYFIELYPNGTLRTFSPYNNQEYYMTGSGQSVKVYAGEQTKLFSDGTLEEGFVEGLIPSGSGQKIAVNGKIVLFRNGTLQKTSFSTVDQVIPTGSGMTAVVTKGPLTLYPNGTLKQGQVQHSKVIDAQGKMIWCDGGSDFNEKGQATCSYSSAAQ